MKRFIVVLLAVLLFALPVMAQEEDNPVVLTWEGDIEDTFVKEGLSGTIYDINDLGIKFLVPEGLEPTEVSEADMEENGVFAAFLSEDGKKQIIVSFRDLEVDTLGDVALLARDSIGEENFHYGGFYRFNGLNGIVFMDANRDQLTAAIGTTEPQHFIQITMLPISNEEMNALSGFVLGSIQPYSAE